jgi:RNA polymerase sigma-70 factor (ECF subfamily)
MQITTYQSASKLWLAYAEGLRDYLRRRTVDDALSEELTHRVLLKVVNSCCSGREVHNEGAWLFRISHNVLMDHYKEAGGGAQVPAWTEETEGADVLQELAVYVRPLIGLLPKKYADPLKLADIDGIPQAEIARQLGLGLSATKSRIQRARLRLRDKIAECTYLITDADGRPVDFALREDCRCLQDHPSTTSRSFC